ncbi:hypothetical protein MKK75_31320 [Methylobacterium sp. J-030]|uniref:hypothetical protein n=1 Tax=Methylobacterium sp. J-030 TaxID=2836627 RepID=UPI001FBA22B3|nr:hypothetical protein [Methylobacterium sp. J-030]MCJ2073224.1 hypothetical protein [Methylobacterium sp. J-030]
MSTLFSDPLGRALLTLLTTDHGLPGGPQRAVLLRSLLDLRTQAETRGASAQVRGAIRSALWALRGEFPAASVSGTTVKDNHARRRG